jgi:hypothetical protein
MEGVGGGGLLFGNQSSEFPSYEFRWASLTKVMSAGMYYACVKLKAFTAKAVTAGNFESVNF